MSEETTAADSTCAICGRTLLMGERSSRFVDPEGKEVTVCELCKPRAEAGGWLRPGESRPRSGEGRRRQRGQFLGGLRRRVEREQGRQRSGERGEKDGASDVRRARPGRERPPAKSRGPDAGESVPAGRAVGPDLDEALAAFNASEQRRTVAGLTRSLGTPRATGLAIRTAQGANGARLTVVWELAWYQWVVGPGERGPEIREAGKGETVDQLRAADRNWNLEVDRDGSLRRKPREEA